MRGDVFILSAPSGAGKTTLIQGFFRILEQELAGLARAQFSVSHTTRAPRGQEVSGRDYHFVSPGRFRELVAAGGFLEWKEVHGQLYGTTYDEVLPRVDAGIDVLMDIDVQGAREVMASWHGDATLVGVGVHSIFVTPPSYAELEFRLQQRGLDDADEIARRLAASHQEMQQARHYDYVIVNDRATAASHRLAAIILEKKYRQERMQSELNAVLAGFRDPRGPDATAE